MKKNYIATELCKILDIDRSRLQEWMHKGYIKPSIQRATSRGEKNIFSHDDLYIVYLFKHLLERGMNRYTASRFVSILLRNGFEKTLQNGKNYLIWLGMQLEEPTESSYYDEGDSPPFALIVEELPLKINNDVESFVTVILLNIKNSVDSLIDSKTLLS